jgi:hypothetical protein
VQFCCMHPAVMLVECHNRIRVQNSIEDRK